MEHCFSLPYPAFLPWAKYREGDIDKLLATVRAFVALWAQDKRTRDCFNEIRRATKLTQKEAALRFIQRPHDDLEVQQAREVAEAWLAAYVLQHYGKDRPCLVWGLLVHLWIEIGEAATGKPAMLNVRKELPQAIPLPTLPVFTVRYGETKTQAKRRLVREFERYWEDHVKPWQAKIRGARKGVRTWAKGIEPYKPVEQHAQWYFRMKLNGETLGDIDRDYRRSKGPFLSDSHQTIADGIEEARRILDEDPAPIVPMPE